MYEDINYESIKNNILSNIKDLDKREGSFVNDMVSPISIELDGAYQQFNTMLGIMFLDDNTGYYLEKRANEYGVYRKNGTKAIGKVKFTGIEGTIIPKGSLVSTSSNLLFETIEQAVISLGTTAVTTNIIAQDIGSKYNVIENTIISIPVKINGIASVTNESQILSGTDAETDEELLNRTIIQIQNPATSGNATHYKLWSLEVDGIGDAKVFPLWDGNGTVKVMPITSDRRSPGTTIINNVIDNIELNRPIGATVTVVAPEEVSINVNAKITLNSNYTLDKVIEEYKNKFTYYIKSCVFKFYTVDYYKCLSLMYEIEGVGQVIDFKLNNTVSNITISENQIQVANAVTIIQ